MSIRVKTLASIGIIALISILIMLAISRFVLLESYVKLEEELAQQNVQRLENSLLDKADTLSRLTADWAYWDETYEFIEDLNATYVADNLTIETLANLELNMMVYISVEGQIVHSKYIDIQTGEDISPLNLDTIIYSRSPILEFPELTSSVTGFFQTSSGVVEFASRPVLTNEVQGPVNGTLLFGRFVNDNRVQNLAHSLQLNMSVSYLNDDALSSEDVSTIDYSDLGSLIEVLNSNELRAYKPVMDIFGEPILVYEVTIPRSIYKQGLDTTLIFSTALIIIIVAISTAILILIEKQVLQRMLRLRDFFSNVRETDNLTQQLSVNGNDEITQVTHDLNEMVSALNRARHELKQSHARLEQRVEERTIELAEARDQALEAVRIKTQILANVSHDVRTPLNVIMLRAYAIKRYGDLNDKQAQSLLKINSHCEELLDFFNKLLDGAQSESGFLKLNQLTVDISEFTQEVEDIMKPLAKTKSLDFITVIDDKMPKTLSGDIGRLKQIASNLIGNAIKFTAEGSVKLAIQLKDEEHWSIEVSDTGEGIAPETQHRIFEPFYQVDGSVTRNSNRGVGLGLSIVKQLATLMGGDIEVQSTLGEGTTFTVTLPLKPPVESEVILEL